MSVNEREEPPAPTLPTHDEIMRRAIAEREKPENCAAMIHAWGDSNPLMRCSRKWRLDVGGKLYCTLHARMAIAHSLEKSV